MKPTVLFFSSTFKGMDMMRQVHEMGCYVLLMTEDRWRDEPWDFSVIDEFFLTPDLGKHKDVIHTVSYLNRGRQIDYLVPLDEFEVELVSMLREHLRLDGPTVSMTRPYRDKLAMRQLTRQAGLNVPEFVGIKNYDDLRAFMRDVPPMWVLKPRSEASAMGIRKIYDAEQVWRALDELGDLQSYYLIEQFLPGDVFHVDSVVHHNEVVFATAQKYGAPPLQTYQGGGIFTSRVLPVQSAEAVELRAFNEQVIRALGTFNGIRHTEFIRAHANGQFYFLESAARVGGANLADMIAHARGVNLWREWGKIVVSDIRHETYENPKSRDEYAGILMTLARQQHPDLSHYNDSEVVWRAEKAYHAGLIVTSPSYDRVEQLLGAYADRFGQDFMAVAPPMGTQRTG